jgi:diketogulonate reductase-like aldo/keto reductase
MSETLNITSAVELNDGQFIPLLGFGTGSLRGQEAYNSVLAALKTGYKHIDTASWYRNENEVGQAIVDSGVPRDELFITTKIWPTQLANPEKALKNSLRRLGTSYVNLYLIHRQVGSTSNTWNSMEALSVSGLTRSIGVSNFGSQKLEKFINDSTITPAINQVRCSALYYDERMHDHCKMKGVVMAGYSPLTRGHMEEVSSLKGVAVRLGKSPAQVLIRWALELGIPVIPRAHSAEYIESNKTIVYK